MFVSCAMCRLLTLAASFARRGTVKSVLVARACGIPMRYRCRLPGWTEQMEREARDVQRFENVTNS